jgi:hypothetical protein
LLLSSLYRANHGQPEPSWTKYEKTWAKLDQAQS